MTSVCFMLIYLGEAICFPAVPTANVAAFKSRSLVRTAQAWGGAGGAVTSDT